MLFVIKNAPSPPGPFVQNINAFLHKEPIASIAYAIYWTYVFMIATPCVIIFLQVQLAANLLLWLTGQTGTDTCSPRKVVDKELAIVITGCDTGFGREIAFRAAHEGFVVFAACLQRKSLKEFDQEPSIHPLVMDVTNDISVANAVGQFTNWLGEVDSDEKSEAKQDAKRPTRVLHAVINNAGIGFLGEVDWLDISVFEKNMEVNFLGMVRCCKGFLPILKKQAIEKTHTDSRILNICSMAGIIAGPGGTPYTASKHASVAFTSGLRLELKGFGIQVSAVNPTFHGTILVDTIGDVLSGVWNNLPEDKRKEYGEEYFEQYHLVASQGPKLSMWGLEVVVEKVLEMLMTKQINGEVTIGSDARFVFHVVRMLPPRLRDIVLLYSAARLPPAAMVQA